jgi:hypothetical protein
MAFGYGEMVGREMVGQRAPLGGFLQNSPMWDQRASLGQNVVGMAGGSQPMTPQDPRTFQQGRGALLGANRLRQQQQRNVPGTFAQPTGQAPFRQFGPPGGQQQGGMSMNQAAQQRFPAATAWQQQRQQRQQPMGFGGQQQAGPGGQQMGFGSQQGLQQMQQIQTPEQAGQMGYALGQMIRSMIGGA